MKCLFRHDWDDTLSFFVEPPRPPMRNGRRKLEMRLSYNHCRRCGVIQIHPRTLYLLNARIQRSIEWVSALQEGYPYYSSARRP